MRSLMFAIAGAALLAASFAVPEVDAACNARGEYCGHPQWASNAFSGKSGKVPISGSASSSSRRRSR